MNRPSAPDHPASPARTPLRRALAHAACAATLPGASLAQTETTLPEMTVLAERRLDDGSALATAEWTRQDVREAAPRTIDELLATEPSFSLYRRQTSMFGNPSAAGVSLRNTGATAASRTLVLLDGIPQNDPFGGWIYWARYNPAAIESARIVPSASSAAWGNQSPAGVIHLDRRDPFAPATAIEAGGGSQGTVQGSIFHQATNAERDLSAAVSVFGLHSDGFQALDANQRGAVDRKLSLDLSGADVTLAWKPAPGLVLEPGVSLYREQRGNGTDLAANSTDALDLSLRLTAEDGPAPWQAVLWHQERTFRSVFSSVAPGRAKETVALNQYDVPGTGTGGSWTIRRETEGGWSFHGGADFRAVSGETRENVGLFRNRVAGGDQTIAGAFVGAGREIDAATRADASARIDVWSLENGGRVERSLVSGALLRNDSPADRDGWDPTASLALSRKLGAEVDARLSAGTGFRVPTLNELYRPFRVRNDVTEANPLLDPERFTTLEAGLEWKPAPAWRATASLFHHWIADAIANVPVTDPSEISAIFGTLPPGGTGAIKRNVDQARVAGVESGIEWTPAGPLTVSLDALWSDTRFTESKRQPLLEGKPFPQAPDQRIVATAEWRANERLTFFAGWEYGSTQYDDALARRKIDDYTSTRVGLRWQYGSALYHLRVENLFDEAIQTGLSGDGLRTYAAPRSLWAGVSWSL